MKKISIIYGTCTDHTKEAAELIASKLSDFQPELHNVADCGTEPFEQSDCLILGTSTWGCGDLQDDWGDMLDKLSGVELTGKQVALFGLGDSSGFSDTFVDGMGELYHFFNDKGCKIIGQVPTDGYSFDDSTAVVNDEFVGLPLDADNEEDQTEERIEGWVSELKPLL